MLLEREEEKRRIIAAGLRGSRASSSGAQAKCRGGTWGHGWGGSRGSEGLPKPNGSVGINAGTQKGWQ